MAGLAGKDADIWLADNTDSTTMTDEGCDSIGSGTPSLWWQVTDHDKDVWDPSVTFTVEVSTDGGASWSTASTSNYTLYYLFGIVEFASDPFGGSTSGNDVRVDGNYLPKSSVLKGFETEFTMDPQLQEITQFQDESPSRQKGLQAFEGSFGTYQINEANVDHDTSSAGADDDGPTLREILLDTATKGSGNPTDPTTVFRFEPNAAQSTFWGAWVQFAESELSAAIDDPQTRSFSMQVNDQDATMSSQTALGVWAFSPSQV